MNPRGTDSLVILCFTDWTRSQVAVATGTLDRDSAKAAVVTPGSRCFLRSQDGGCEYGLRWGPQLLELTF